MPAALADGGPVVFCPVGLPSGFGQDAGAYHHGDGEDSELEKLAWENCAFGAFFKSDAIVASIPPLAPKRATSLLSTWRQAIVVSSLPAAFHSRAPPALYT